MAHIEDLGNGKTRIWVEGARNPITGKRTQLTKTVPSKKKDIEQALVELSVRGGKPMTTLTFSEYVYGYYLPSKTDVKQTTIDDYMSKLKNHLIPLFGSYDMAKLSPTVVRKCLYALPPKTAKSCRRVLSAILKQAMYDNIIESNPLDSVKPPKTDKYEPAVLDIEDIEVYLWHFRDTKMEPVVLLAIGCGLRRGEIMAIEASDLSSDGILVDDEYVPTSRGVKHDTPKNRKQRKVVMPSKLLERLKEIAPESGPIVTNEAGE